MVRLNYFNNTGGINKFSSVASLNESEVNTDWYDAQNVEGHKSGGIIKMKGNTNICTTALPQNTKILGIWDYTKGSIHYPVINTSEGKLYRLSLYDGSLSQIYSGLNELAKCCYANFNNGVIITNGVDTPIFFEENVGVSVLGGSPPVGRAVEIQGYLLLQALLCIIRLLEIKMTGQPPVMLDLLQTSIMIQVRLQR